MNMLIARIMTFVVLLGATMVCGQNDMKDIEALKTGESARRAEAIQALHQRRQNLIAALVPIMDGAASPDVKIDVARVLGEYRAIEAVDALVRNLELDLRPRILKGLIKEADIHPISQALAKIGNPAIPSLLAKIAETDSSAMIQRCAEICVEIQGQDVAELVVNRQSEKISIPEAKQRLKQALDAIQKVK